MVNVRPPRSVPLSAAIALSASLALVISTNPKPRERPVSRSVTSVIFSTAPCASKMFRNSASVVLWGRFPTYRFFIAIPLSISHLGWSVSGFVSRVVLQNLVAEWAERASLGFVQWMRSGLWRFASKLPGCPSAESNLHDRRQRRVSSHPRSAPRFAPPTLDPRWENLQDILVGRPGTPTSAGEWHCEFHHKICRDGPVPFPY